MDEQVSIKNLTEYGNGWKWTVSAYDWGLGRVADQEYRTDRHGEGLWAVGSYTGNWADNYQDKQILGTCQFILNGSRKRVYGKIRRYFEK